MTDFIKSYIEDATMTLFQNRQRSFSIFLLYKIEKQNNIENELARLLYDVVVIQMLLATFM